MIRIRPYRKSDHQDFKDISYEWLRAYVSVEPIDEEILANPDAFILRDGGRIWMALEDDKAIGTISIINHQNGVYEIAKLGVLSHYRKRGVGSLLMETAIHYSKEHNIKQLILYTASELKAARKLYEKFGFKNDASNDNKYQDADLKLYLNL